MCRRDFRTREIAQGAEREGQSGQDRTALLPDPNVLESDRRRSERRIRLEAKVDTIDNPRNRPGHDAWSMRPVDT